MVNHKGSSSSSRKKEECCNCGQYYCCSENDDGEDNHEDDDEFSETTKLISNTATNTNSIMDPSSSFITVPLDASFVHLPRSSFLPSLNNKNTLKNQTKNNNINNNNNANSTTTTATTLLNHFKHLQVLEQAVLVPDDDNENKADSNPTPPRLCIACVHRVGLALDVDSDRLRNESRSYREAMQKQRSQIQNWKRALQIAASSNYNNNESVALDEIGESRLLALQHERDNLKELMKKQEQELADLNELEKQQARTSKDLDEWENQVEHDYNSLEIESRAFNNVHEQLYRNLQNIQDQVGRLSSPNIKLVSTMYRLTVDTERGLRYPMINGLRLAYRDKGDLQSDEIQAAWSLAAQLLLVVGNLFQFQSPHWKIVPLSNCAKIIYLPSSTSSSSSCVPSSDQQQQKQSDRKNEQRQQQHQTTDSSSNRALVYSLGNPRTDTAKSLQAWNALLHQVVHHTTIKVHNFTESGLFPTTSISNSASNANVSCPPLPTLPYEISANKIGTLNLAQLLDSDDASWSKAIHCMACNLLWLSECASAFLLQKVLLTTNLMVDDDVYEGEEVKETKDSTE